MHADAMDLDEFERIMSQAVAELPEWVRAATADVAILVDDQPPADWDGDCSAMRSVMCSDSVRLASGSWAGTDSVE